MVKASFSEDFKRDAVAQITERGCPVAEVSRHLGVSQHSLYAWKRKYAKVSSGEADKDAEIRRLVGLHSGRRNEVRNYIAIC